MKPNPYIQHRAYIYSLLYYYTSLVLPFHGLLDWLEYRAVSLWNEWYEENLNCYLHNYGKFRKNSSYILIRCRTPFTNQSAAHGVWIPDSEVVDVLREYEFSNLRIIIGPQFKEYSFNIELNKLQSKIKSVDFNLFYIENYAITGLPSLDPCLFPEIKEKKEIPLKKTQKTKAQKKKSRD